MDITYNITILIVLLFVSCLILFILGSTNKQYNVPGVVYIFCFIIIIYLIYLLLKNYLNDCISGYKKFYLCMLSKYDIRLIDANNSKEMETKRDWDIIVYNYDKLWEGAYNGTLGIGEAFVNKYWDCKSLDILYTELMDMQKIISKLNNKIDTTNNLQTREKSFEVQNIHYNIDYNFYTKMLGPSMAYSCGYWKNANTLDEAQFNKFKLICEKLELKRTDHVLDIGCGYGSLMLYITQNYGCKCTGVNISKEQLRYAKKLCKDYPITFLECDYRDIPNYKYDKIVSVGFCEHVGYKNYDKFMDVVEKNLKDDGLFLLHTIGGNVSTTCGDAWLDKYIFPNGMLPSISQLSKAMEGKFVMEDWHNFGLDYDKTLMSWYDNYTHAKNNGNIVVSDKFDRIWKYYLLSCAGCFRSRLCQLWQIVLSKSRKQPYYGAR